MLKIGVLGAGYLGKIHIKCIKLIKDYNLVGFYDVNTNTAKSIAEEYNIKAFNNIDELISQVDAIDIVTPTSRHFECALAALRKSKNIFIEKPVVATYEEAEQLKKIAANVNVKIQVGHIERFNPAFVAVKDLIHGPIFLEVHRLAPYNSRGTDVPVTLDLMIHDIDILLHVVSSKVSHISACGVPIVSKTADIANARIEFENGAAANLTASRLALKKMRKCRIFQPNSYIVIDYLQQLSEIITISDEPDYSNPFAMIAENVSGYDSPRQMIFNRPKIIKTNAIEMELRSFYNSIVNDTTPVVTLNDGISALDIAFQINKLVDESVNNYHFIK